MLETIEPRQFKEWMAEYSIQPWDIEGEYTPEQKQTSISESLAAMRRMTGV